MPVPTLSQVWFWVFTVMCAGVGACLGAYLKQWGKNLATHEDFEKLLVEQKSSTEATKSIEARISNEMWDRQKQWELKKEAVFDAVSMLGKADDALLALSTAYGEAAKSGEPEKWRETKLEKSIDYQTAMNLFDEKRFIAALVCTSALESALRKASREIRVNASKVFKGQFSEYSELSVPVQQRINDVMTLARKELGLDAQQS